MKEGKKPNVKRIEAWTQDDVTKWFLYKMAHAVNELDTIRNITPDNHTDMLASRKAVELIENLLLDIYKELPKLQVEVAEKEFNISKKLFAYKDADY